MDIKKRKKTEEKLSQYEFIVNTSREFMTIINQKYEYEAVNKAYVEAINKKEEEIIGKTVAEIWGEKQFQKIIKPNIISAFQGKEIHYQSWFSFPKGERRYFDVAYYPYKDEAGNVTHLVIVTRNITTQKEMENQLRKAEKLAAVGELSAGIAHEIRNPLAIMKSTAQYAQKHYREMQSDALQQTMDVFVETANRIDKTILDLIEFTRPRGIYVTEKNIIEILQRTLDTIAEDCTKNKVKIEFHCQKDEIYLRVDEEQLQKAFWHLFMNALEAQPAGGMIKIEVQENDEIVKITITDKGEGIHEQNVSKIFHPFFSTKSTGTGLGLNFVYHIVKEHEGKIDITSQEKRGTVVTIKFYKYGGRNV